MFTRAFSPTLGGHLARLRRAEVALAGRAPRPGTVAVLTVAPRSGASTLAALLGQVLGALAPGRVAILDTDGQQQAQRVLANARNGSLRHLIHAGQPLHSRRTVERYVDQSGAVPVLAAAAAERSPLMVGEAAAALGLLQRRYPVVVVDAPRPLHNWALATADRVVLIGPPQALLDAAPRVVHHRGRRPTLPVIAGMDKLGSSQAVFPVDPSIVSGKTIRLDLLSLRTRGAVEEITDRLLDGNAPLFSSNA